MFFNHGWKRSLSAALIFLIQTGVGDSAAAGTLTIETMTTARVTNGLLTVDVTVYNTGDADAKDVRIHLFCLDRHQKGRIRPILEPGDSDTVKFQETVSGVQKGRRPLTVQVDFHDARNHPFSAISGRTFSVGKDVEVDLEIVAENITIAERGKLNYKITNTSEESRRIRANLILPRELTTPNPSIDFTLTGGEKKQLPFHIKQFSALKASYPVFCYFEFDAGGIHYTSVVKAVVTVIREENWFRRTRRVWIFIGGVLVLLFVVSLFKHPAKHRNPLGRPK